MNSKDIHINKNGFREYDARWLYPKDISLEGITTVGLALGTQIQKHKIKNPRVIVGHDYRSYSEEVKNALIKGLMESGCNVEDIGLSLTPMVYFSQFELNADAIAMVTASHNENGWTGIKMGIEKGLTHAPDEMKELKDIVFSNSFSKGKGTLKKIDNFKQVYSNYLISKNKINKKIKAVVACGNGTAGVFAPDILRGIGCEVIELDCNLDYTFPKYNPNPEDMEMLHAISKAVKENNADIGFGFDGDGDRVGVIDNKGREIFSDKIGLLIARNISKKNKGQKFIIDVKSTCLYSTDEVLKENNCEVLFWKTGHSHIKRKVKQAKAIAGFEKSGHFFFNQPIGLGFDDGIMSAIQVCHLLSNENKKMSEIIDSLPTTYQTPTMAPFCKDEEKYQVVDQIIKQFEGFKANKTTINGKTIKELITINGVRFILEDNSWGLIRASSNKPSLVVVVETLTSDKDTKAVFDFIDKTLQATNKVGEYDQKI